MLLAGWSWEEAEERYNCGRIGLCSVTTYTCEASGTRFCAADVARVYWSEPGD